MKRVIWYRPAVPPNIRLTHHLNLSHAPGNQYNLHYSRGKEKKHRIFSVLPAITQAGIKKIIWLKRWHLLNKDLYESTLSVYRLETKTLDGWSTGIVDIYISPLQRSRACISEKITQIIEFKMTDIFYSFASLKRITKGK